MIREGSTVRYSRAWYEALCKRVGRKVSGPHCGALDGFAIVGEVLRIRPAPPGRPYTLEAMVRWADSHEEFCTILDGRIELAE